MVLDRLFLWIFTVAVLVGTCGIILHAPTLYDTREPIDVCGLDVKRRKGKFEWQEKRAENREGSLGFPGFVKPVFTKDSKPLGKRKRSLGYLGSVKPVLT
ncbi:hypothetical protein TNCV_644971 [Trichonephila clavipes]|nr:hypothetical protein TNCV_644971 [Trichonephila clavipes]